MLEQIKEKMKNGHVRYITTAVAVVALVALILFLKNEADHKTYTSYTVELQKEKTENASKYEYVNGSILRYSIDGASLLRKDLEAAWTIGFSMMDPRLDLCGTHILIYDRLGTQAVILDMKGQVSSFSALGPILTARISARDTVAMLVQDGDKVDFIYYSGTGEQIASGESSMSDPGYPLALAVSDDGTDVAISYLSAAEGSISSIVRFYNFGTKGKGQVNNMTGEDAFEGVIAPDIDYLNGNECVVFRDNGFTVYKGQNGTAYRSVDFDHEIVSVFHDGSHMGFVFDSEDKEHRFDMQIYTTSGNLVSSCCVDQTYRRVHVCGDWVIFSSNAEFSLYSMKGYCKYSGTLQGGGVADVLRIGKERIFALTDYFMEVLKME